jgi:hypothetical protein
MQYKSAKDYYLQGNYSHRGTSEGLIAELVPVLLTILRGCGRVAVRMCPKDGLPGFFRFSDVFSCLHGHPAFLPVQSLGAEGIRFSQDLRHWPGGRALLTCL